MQNSPFNRLEARSGPILTKNGCHTLYNWSTLSCIIFVRYSRGRDILEYQKIDFTPTRQCQCHCRKICLIVAYDIHYTVFCLVLSSHIYVEVHFYINMKRSLDSHIISIQYLWSLWQDQKQWGKVPTSVLNLWHWGERQHLKKCLQWEDVCNLCKILKWIALVWVQIEINETRSYSMFLQLFSQKAPSLMNLQTPTPCQKQINHKVHGKMSSRQFQLLKKHFSQQIFQGDIIS